MIGQKTGMTILQSREYVVGERLSAKDRIRGARDRFPAGYCHHVMERRNLPVCAGKRRGIRRVGMDHVNTRTPASVPINSTSAGRRAKIPLQTTPAILLISASSFAGSRIARLWTSKITWPLSVVKPVYPQSDARHWAPSHATLRP